MKNPEEVPELNDEEAYKSFAADIMVTEFGPMCAAWLVRTHKKQFRGMIGRLRTVVPVADISKVRPWFFIALAYFRRRPKWWTVTEAIDGDDKVWTIGWKQGEANA
jgi:hypothetical protein